MDKFIASGLIKEYGQAIITYKGLNSKKQKYNVGTLQTNAYIKTKKNKCKQTEETIVLFCWDSDTFRSIRVKDVLSIVPLAKVLKNVV